MQAWQRYDVHSDILNDSRDSDPILVDGVRFYTFQVSSVLSFTREILSKIRSIAAGSSQVVPTLATGNSISLSC
jgi:hypothetical protein